MKIHTLSTTKGAAVFKGDSMVRSAVERGGGELRKWAKENAQDIFESEKWTQKYGFFVITATYRARRCVLKCWQQSSQSHSYKLDIHASGLPGGANAGINTVQAARSAGWIVPPLHNDVKRLEIFLSDCSWVMRWSMSVLWREHYSCLGHSDL
jgi:hypothetical protein